MQSVASLCTPYLSMIHIVTIMSIMTSKLNRVHPFILSAKFDEEAHNGVVSIMFTRSRHGHTEPQQCYYIAPQRVARVIRQV